MMATGPVLIGMVLLVYGMHLARPHADAAKFGPFWVLFAGWFVGAWFVQRRNARRLQQRLDELDALKQG